MDSDFYFYSDFWKSGVCWFVKQVFKKQQPKYIIKNQDVACGAFGT